MITFSFSKARVKHELQGNVISLSTTMPQACGVGDQVTLQGKLLVTVCNVIAASLIISPIIGLSLVGEESIFTRPVDLKWPNRFWCIQK